MNGYTAHPIPPTVLEELRTTDDAGRAPAPATDDEGGAPLRCCLRRSRAGERIALVSYAPLRRWAARTAPTRAPTTSRARSSSTPRSARERRRTVSPSPIRTGLCAATPPTGTSWAGG